MHRIGRGYLAPGARDAIGERRKGVQRRDTDLQSNRVSRQFEELTN
jgi:hypothetical protein